MLSVSVSLRIIENPNATYICTENQLKSNVPCAHMAAPILFETVNASPMSGMPSSNAAAKPNTGDEHVSHPSVKSKDVITDVGSPTFAPR